MITTTAETAYWDALKVIKGRWTEAEAVNATDPQWAYEYAYDVIKGRWPEAELSMRGVDGAWA